MKVDVKMARSFNKAVSNRNIRPIDTSTGTMLMQMFTWMLVHVVKMAILQTIKNIMRCLMF